MKNILKILTALLSLLIVFSLHGCKEEEDDPGIVNFLESSYNLTTDDLTPFDVEFTIDPPAPKASEFTVSVSGGEYGTVYTTTPALSGGQLVVSVASGDTEASFTVTPLEEGIGFDDVQLSMSLVSAEDGLTTGLTTSSQINIVNAKDKGMELPFTEAFDGCAEGGSGEPIPDGWTEVVAQQNGEGSAVWNCINSEFFGVVGLEANAFVPGSEDLTSSELWLVSPRINLTEATAPVMSFDVDRRFDPTETFTEDHYDIVVSTDYTGLNFDDATWTRFQAGYDAMTANDAGADDMANTGDLDLSAYVGEVMAFAFIYRAGAAGSFDATILRVGNISITD